jgi:poly-gamma-glutamate capsule biosynthesis protein CapA/YwtB (metallophosphatase superfamily)
MADTVMMAVVGDCFPTDRFYANGLPLTEGFDRTLQQIQATDLRFGNFEPPLSERGTPAEKLAAIRSHPSVAQDFNRLNFDIVTLANNHVTDYGPDALADTIRIFDDLGVRHVGAGPTLDDAVAPAIIEHNGVRLGFIAFTCLAAPNARATDGKPGVAAIRVHSGYEVDPLWEIEEPGEPLMVTIRTRADDTDTRFALARIADLRSRVDFLCVSLHMGYGGANELAEYQRPLSHAVIDAGADAIFGNHTHAVQGIELYNGKPILYSPGTFIGRQEPFDTTTMSDSMLKIVAQLSPDGYVARLRVSKDGSSSLELLPISVDDHGLPLLAEGEVADRIFARVRAHSAKLDTPVELREGRIVPTGT